MKWVITLIASVFIALQCACMLLAEAKLAEFKYKVMWSLYFGNSKAGAIILFLGYGLCATFAASLLVLFVSPRAASSGIPDMKARYPPCGPPWGGCAAAARVRSFLCVPLGDWSRGWVKDCTWA